MRHPKTDATELQMEALLRSAADFEPELEVPFDLVERALQRATRQAAVVRIQRPIVTLLWGGAAGAAAASAAAAFLITAPAPSLNSPAKAKEASIGSVASGFRFDVRKDREDERVEARPPTRSVPVRRSPINVAAENGPVRQVAWQTEDVEHTVEQSVRPALRFQFDEEGRPVDLQAGLLETLTVSENPVACGTAGDESETGDPTDETSGEGRLKEENLPSKED